MVDIFYVCERAGGGKVAGAAAERLQQRVVEALAALPGDGAAGG